MPETKTNQHKNEMHLAGVLAKEPTIRMTPTGKKVASLTVATTNKGHTDYHRIVCWEELANRVEGLPKGEFIKLVGRLQTRSWEDNNKSKHYTTEIVCWNLSIPARDPVTVSTNGTGVTDEDIPF